MTLDAESTVRLILGLASLVGAGAWRLMGLVRKDIAKLQRSIEKLTENTHRNAVASADFRGRIAVKIGDLDDRLRNIESDTHRSAIRLVPSE